MVFHSDRNSKARVWTRKKTIIAATDEVCSAVITRNFFQWNGSITFIYIFYLLCPTNSGYRERTLIHNPDFIPHRTVITFSKIIRKRLLSKRE